MRPYASYLIGEYMRFWQTRMVNEEGAPGLSPLFAHFVEN